jgi:hypothetical protein
MALGINILENIPEQSGGSDGEFYAKNYIPGWDISSSFGETPKTAGTTTQLCLS